eukprot:m.1451029 g.1451029  ORF g.1451029 m.1451029 type:complete len:101 (+) comp25116_c0_seq8:1163-1465(+)
MGSTQVFNVAGVNRDAFLEHVSQNKRTYADWSRGWNSSTPQQTMGKEDGLASPFINDEFGLAVDRGVITQSEAADLSGTWSALSDAGVLYRRVLRCCVFV